VEGRRHRLGDGVRGRDTRVGVEGKIGGRCLRSEGNERTGEKGERGGDWVAGLGGKG